MSNNELFTDCSKLHWDKKLDDATVLRVLRDKYTGYECVTSSESDFVVALSLLWPDRYIVLTPGQYVFFLRLCGVVANVNEQNSSKKAQSSQVCARCAAEICS